MPLIEEIASDSEENDSRQSSVAVPPTNAERLEVQSEEGVDLCFIPRHQVVETDKAGFILDTLENSISSGGDMHIFSKQVPSIQHESHVSMIQEVEVADSCNELLACDEDTSNNAPETYLPLVSYSVNADGAVKSTTDREDSGNAFVIRKCCAMCVFISYPY